jgi:hypothetical protein
MANNNNIPYQMDTHRTACSTHLLLFMRHAVAAAVGGWDTAALQLFIALCSALLLLAGCHANIILTRTLLVMQQQSSRRYQQVRHCCDYCSHCLQQWQKRTTAGESWQICMMANTQQLVSACNSSKMSCRNSKAPLDSRMSLCPDSPSHGSQQQQEARKLSTTLCIV